MNGTDEGAKNHFDDVLSQTESTIKLLESSNDVKLQEDHKKKLY